MKYTNHSRKFYLYNLQLIELVLGFYRSIFLQLGDEDLRMVFLEELLCRVYLYIALLAGCLTLVMVNWRRKVGFMPKLILATICTWQISSIGSLMQKLPDGSMEYVLKNLNQPIVIFCAAILVIFSMLGLFYSVILTKLMNSMCDHRLLF